MFDAKVIGIVFEVSYSVVDNAFDSGLNLF